MKLCKQCRKPLILDWAGHLLYCRECLKGLLNLVESMTEEQEQSPCKYGNIVIGHACYCHNGNSPYRKCPQWSNGEPYDDCVFFDQYNANNN